MLTWWLARGRREGHGLGGPAALFMRVAVLALLRRGPTHGYQLLTGLVGEGFLPKQPDIGHLYRVLRAMEAEGLVTSEWSQDTSGPLKRVYRLTPAGHEALHRWLEGVRALKAWLDGFVERCEKEVREDVG